MANTTVDSTDQSKVNDQQQTTKKDSQLSTVAQLSDVQSCKQNANQPSIVDQQTGQMNVQPVFQSANELTSLGNEFTTLGTEFSTIGHDLAQLGQDMNALQTDIGKLLNIFGNGGTPTDSTPGTTPGSPMPGDKPPSTSPGSTTPGDNTPATTPGSTTPPGTAPTGNFQVKNGEIVGPNGQTFTAKGIADYGPDALGDMSQINQQFPGANMIRLASNPSQDSPQEIQQVIDAYTAKGIVVEVEDHTSAGTDGTFSNVLTGQDLQNEENWYSQIAAANKNNPYVWFGTANEPNDPSNQQNVVDQEVGIYNAIRQTGNNNMIMMELQGGGSAAPMQADASAYANMTNVAWDAHYYGWVNGYQGGPGVAQGLQNEVQQAQQVHSADGTVPVIVGEYGNSTTGAGNVDPNASDVLSAVQQSGLGSIAWAWNNSENGNSDSLSNGSGGLTDYGQEVASYINQSAPPQPFTPGTPSDTTNPGSLPGTVPGDNTTPGSVPTDNTNPGTVPSDNTNPSTQPTGGPAQPGTWTTQNINGMNYDVLLPPNYDSNQKYPTVLYLHQLDMGTDPTDLHNEVDPWFNALESRSPAIVVMPLLDQTADPSGVTINFGGVSPEDNQGETNALAALKQAMTQYSSDPSRVYVTGNSLGGIGTWDMMVKYNAYNGTEGKIFAAGMPLAGNDYGQDVSAAAQQLRNVPIWAIHGGQDTQVPLNWDQSMSQSLSGDPNFKYTQIDSLGHDVWDTVYPDAQYWDWLFSQKAPTA